MALRERFLTTSNRGVTDRTPIICTFIPQAAKIMSIAKGMEFEEPSDEY